jgi:hypothetical protein
MNHRAGLKYRSVSWTDWKNGLTVLGLAINLTHPYRPTLCRVVLGHQSMFLSVYALVAVADSHIFAVPVERRTKKGHRLRPMKDTHEK